jgi:hypothetical protein
MFAWTWHSILKRPNPSRKNVMSAIRLEAEHFPLEKPLQQLEGGDLEVTEKN